MNTEHKAEAILEELGHPRPRDAHFEDDNHRLTYFRRYTEARDAIVQALKTDSPLFSIRPL